MITKEKLEGLRQKMIHHDVVNDQAVVTITARELHDLIEAAEGYMTIITKEFHDRLDEGKR